MADQLERRRNPFLPWLIGLAVIIAAAVYVGYQLACLDCGPPGLLEFIVVGVMPVVYLTLMYMSLRSQADSERP
jgi:hypothetical protein